jgi:predicted RNA-binding Zn-ribbon protein involved in translation (DUF1610 family)
LTEVLARDELLATEAWDFDAGEYTTMGVAIESRHRWTTVDRYGVPAGGIPYNMPQEHKERIWARFRELTHDGPMEDFIRRAICFTFAECQHTQKHYLELESGWTVEICLTCGQQVSRHCQHGKSVWQLDGQLLVCPRCGIDGT